MPSCSRVLVFLFQRQRTSEEPHIVASIGAAFLTDRQRSSRWTRMSMSLSRQSRTDSRVHAMSLWLCVGSHEASRLFCGTKDLHRVDRKRRRWAADSTALVSVILILNCYYDSISHRLLFCHEVSSDTECGT